jgi:ZIP family zinc transporter
MFETLLFSLAATASAAAGVAALAAWPALAQGASGLLEAAAGGALLIMGVAYLAPEALHLYPAAWGMIAFGVALGAALHRGASILAGARAGALTLLAGLALHSLLDGVAFAIALAADPVFGLGSAAGFVLHDAPKALFAFVLLRRAGFGAAASAAGAMLVAAGFSALGAFAAAPVADGLPLPALGALTGIAAGLLVYAGLACLFTLRQRPFLAKAASAAAAAAAIAVIGQFGHTHPDGEGAVAAQSAQIVQLRPGP